MGVALGPVVGGAIAEGISWHWIFWVNVPIGLVLVPVARRALSESHGPNTQLDLRGLALAGGGLMALVLGIVRANELGWTSPTIVGLFGDRRRAAGGLPALGAPRAGADAAAALLPQPRLLGDQRRLVRDVLRRLRLDLLPVAVLPDGSGTLAAGVGPADAAVDGDADARRADRRAAVGPHRRSPADGGRPRAAGRRGRRGWRSSPASTSAYATLVPAFVLGGAGHGDGLRAVGQRRAERRPPAGGRPGLGRDEHDPRARRRDGDRRAGERLRRAPAATSRRRTTSTGWTPRCRSAPRCCSPAPAAALLVPGKRSERRARACAAHARTRRPAARGRPRPRLMVDGSGRAVDGAATAAFPARRGYVVAPMLRSVQLIASLRARRVRARVRRPRRRRAYGRPMAPGRRVLAGERRRPHRLARAADVRPQAPPARIRVGDTTYVGPWNNATVTRGTMSEALKELSRRYASDNFAMFSDRAPHGRGARRGSGSARRLFRDADVLVAERRASRPARA